MHAFRGGRLMPKVTIDKHAHDCPAGKNLLEVALSAGIDLPYFCWHPEMGSVGACRQCAVRVFKDENDTQGRIVMACMTPADDGTHCSVADAEATEMRRQVVEWLMSNHPHDCPVCEEGGECHLQDMTIMTGQVYRRHRFAKRTHRNQDLGPFIEHEMNRCIACYRCTRYYRDYAGGTDLNVYNAHHHVYFGRAEDGPLESEFAGNLVEVCPTGVFTDKALSARYNRKWDLQSAPAVCAHCAVGCNTSPGERHGQIKRVHNRFNDAINRYFLCDRGRYGFDYTNRDDRPRVARVRDAEAHSVVAPDQALIDARGALAQGTAIGFGSPGASIEANAALQALVGADNFYSGASLPDDAVVAAMLGALRATTARAPELAEIEQADAVLILGDDPTQLAPRVALAVRQAARNTALAMADEQQLPHWNDLGVRNIAQGATSPVFIASPDATGLDDLATDTARLPPHAIAALAGSLDADHPEWAHALRQAERPLVIASGTAGIVDAAAALADALAADTDAALVLCPPEANSLGLAMLDAQPTDAGLQRLEHGDVATAVVLCNDLSQRAPQARALAALNKAGRVIAITHQADATSDAADILLPAASHFERTGSFVNHAGRAQRSVQVFHPNRPGTDDAIRPAWRWLADLAGRNDWPDLDALIAHIEARHPALDGLGAAALKADWRDDNLRLARAPHRQSGRTAKDADITVHEPELPEDTDAPFKFSMEGHYGQQPGSALPFVWHPNWSSNHAVLKFQDEIGGPLRGGSGGIRLLDGDTPAGPAGAGHTPPGAGSDAPELVLIAQPHCFGSELTSAASAPIAERAPSPYLALNLSEATALGVTGGDTVTVTTDAGEATLRVALRPRLADGCAAVGLNIGDTAGWPLPMAATITKVAS